MGGHVVVGGFGKVPKVTQLAPLLQSSGP